MKWTVQLLLEPHLWRISFANKLWLYMIISSVERVSKDETKTWSCSLFSESGAHSVVQRNFLVNSSRGKTTTTCSFGAMFSGAPTSHCGSSSCLKVGGGPWSQQYANSINKSFKWTRRYPKTCRYESFFMVFLYLCGRPFFVWGDFFIDRCWL